MTPTRALVATLKSNANASAITTRFGQLPVLASVGYLWRRGRLVLGGAATGGVVVQRLSITPIDLDPIDTSPLSTSEERYVDGLLGARARIQILATAHLGVQLGVGFEALVRGTAPTVVFQDGVTEEVYSPDRLRAVVSLGIVAWP